MSKEVASAIRQCLETPYRSLGLVDPANITDALYAIADALNRIADKMPDAEAEEERRRMRENEKYNFG